MSRCLKGAKAAGPKVVIQFGRRHQLDEARLKARLQAIKDAGLGWKDFWVPGKPEATARSENSSRLSRG